MPNYKEIASRVQQLAAVATGLALDADNAGAEEMLIKAANVLAAAGLCQKTRDVRVVRG